MGPLKLQRQRVEDALERVAARPPAFARQGTVTALLAQASTRGLPLAIVAGWVALTLYTLALPLPLPTDSKAPTAALESRTNGTTAPAARPAVAPAARAATGPAVETSAAPTEPAAAPTNDSPLLEFFRRAVNTPPAAEQQEGIKP